MTDATLPPLHCADLAPERLPDDLHFFDHVAFSDNPRRAGCDCYFPLHDPQVIPWHDRGGADNRSAVQQAVVDGSARGVLAYRGTQVVGWCSAGPRAQYPMLRDLPPPPDADRLGVVFRFVVALLVRKALSGAAAATA